MNDILREKRLRLPDSEKLLNIVIDTDAYNEVDDLFAVSWALLSPSRFKVHALYAEPFLNFRCTNISDATEKSYAELHALTDCMSLKYNFKILMGAQNTYSSSHKPVDSEAVQDMITRAMDTDPNGDPLYVVALGPLTSVASALMLNPQIIDRIVVVWMGYGIEEDHWAVPMCPNTLVDIEAARYVMNCGVPLIQIPGAPVSSHLITTIYDLEHYLSGKNALCNMLIERFKRWQKSWAKNEYAWSKSLWDIGAIAVLLNSDWCRSYVLNCPIIPKNFGKMRETDVQEFQRGDSRYPSEFIPCTAADPSKPRHKARIIYEIRRNPVYLDLYKKLSSAL